VKELVYHRMLLPAVERNADRTGFFDGDYRATFGEHLDRVARLCGALRDLGVASGDRVAVMALNSHQFLESYHASFLGAGVINPLNLRLAPKELEYILGDSGTKVCLTDAFFAPVVDKVRAAVGLEHVVMIGSGDAPYDVAYEEMLAAANPVIPDEPEETDPVVLMYTGGTTGLPKGVLLDHRAEMLNLYHVMQMWRFVRDDVFLHQTPMFHAASMGGMLGVPAQGGVSVFLPLFDPAQVMALCEQYSVTGTVMVPTMIGMLVSHPEYRPKRLASLRMLTYGASPMPEALLTQLLRGFPALDIYQGYGMTESSAVLTALGPEDHRAGGARLRSAGLPLPGVVVSIQDPDGNRVAPGETGEVCARAGNFMREYWNKPEATADAFRGGVRLYLDRYRFANTETTDLWDALEEATREPVRRIMDTWIFQPGLPAVRVDGDRLRIEQRRFTYEDGDREGLWVLPLLARVHNGGRAETRSLLLSEKEMTIDAPADALVVLNAGGEGFYRVAYPREQRDRLLDAGVLEPLERFALVDDLWASVLAGEISAEEFLGCAHRFTDETDLVVWKVLIAHLRAAARFVTGDALERMHAEIAAIVGPARERLGWDARPADDPRTRQLRGLMIDALGSTVGDRSTIARAREVDAAGTRDPDVEAAAVAVVASAGTRDDFDRFLARSAAASSPQAQLRYLYALGEFPSEEMVLQACELAISDEVRAQNGPFLLQRALRNREHGAAAWAFVRDHWDTVRTRFSPGLLPRVIEGTTWLVEDAVAGDVLTFVDAHPVAAGARTIAQHMERLRVHRAAVQRERGRLSAALLGGAST